MSLQETLINEVVATMKKKIVAIISNSQQWADMESLCADLNDAAAELKIDFKAQPVVCVHDEGDISSSIMSFDRVTIWQTLAIIDAAGLLCRLEKNSSGFGHSKSLVFGVEGFSGQLIILDPLSDQMAA